MATLPRRGPFWVPPGGAVDAPTLARAWPAAAFGRPLDLGWSVPARRPASAPSSSKREELAAEAVEERMSMIDGRSVDGSFYTGRFRPTAMSCDTRAVRIKQRYAPIRIARAERVVQAASNIEPVRRRVSFHERSPIPDAIRIARFSRGCELFGFKR